MHTVFLSYTAADWVTVRELSQALRQRGIDVWSDPELLGSKSQGREGIRQAISTADCVLVLITPTTLSSSSLPNEWADAFSGSTKVVPVLAQGARFADLEEPLAKLRGVDLDQDPNGIEKLLQVIDGDGGDAAATTVVGAAGQHDVPTAALAGPGLDPDEAVDVTEEQLLPRPEVEPMEQADNLVFVVTAFSDDMEYVYEAIKDKAAEVGLQAMRVKDSPGDYKITDRILDFIGEARLVIADLTHERPNVYFELGYARGLGKTVVTIARKSTRIHFDVRSWSYFEYVDSRHLEEYLIKRFKYELER